tara:strand:- start:1345 stop:1908 length:564 start_codon:yes stop_codon:yes gene_type:complete
MRTFLTVVLLLVAGVVSAQVARIGVQHSANESSVGTAIPIYSREGKTLYLTCAHVADRQTCVISGAPGRVIARDIDRDVALVQTTVQVKRVATFGEDLKPGERFWVGSMAGEKFQSVVGVAVSSRKGNYKSANGWSGAPVGGNGILQAMHLGRIGEGKLHAHLLPVSQIKEFLKENEKVTESCIGFT